MKFKIGDKILIATEEDALGNFCGTIQTIAEIKNKLYYFKDNKGSFWYVQPQFAMEPTELQKALS